MLWRKRRRTRGSAGAVAAVLLLAVSGAIGGCRASDARTVADAGCLSCHEASRRPPRRTRVASPATEATRRQRRRKPATRGSTASRTRPTPAAGARLQAVPPPPGRADEQQPDVHEHGDDRPDPGHLEGERAGVVYASPAGETHTLDGTPLKHEPVARLDNVSGDLYRKFCSRCHVARQNEALDGNGHPAGCAACHFPYGERAATSAATRR